MEGNRHPKSRINGSLRRFMDSCLFCVALTFLLLGPFSALVLLLQASFDVVFGGPEPEAMSAWRFLRFSLTAAFVAAVFYVFVSPAPRE